MALGSGERWTGTSVPCRKLAESLEQASLSEQLDLMTVVLHFIEKMKLNCLRRLSESWKMDQEETSLWILASGGGC